VIKQNKITEQDYDPEIVSLAKQRISSKNTDEIALLEKNIIAGLPGGAESHGTGEFSNRVARFKDISNDDMRLNLTSFLDAVIPTAEKYWPFILMIHPSLYLVCLVLFLRKKI